MIVFECLRYDPQQTLDLLGYIPSFLNEDDPRPAKQQLHENYAHGGGWNSFKQFMFNPQTLDLTYPGDPTYHAVAKCTLPLHNEEVIVYQHAWVLIRNTITKEWDVARLD